LIREVKEELSVDLVEESIRFLGNFEEQAHGHAEGVMVKMQCYTSKFKGDLKPAAEIEAMIWLNFKDLEEVSPVDKIIFKWLKEKDLIT
jgi:8-oxo-dGTP diphosphatase